MFVVAAAERAFNIYSCTINIYFDVLAEEGYALEIAIGLPTD